MLIMTIYHFEEGNYIMLTRIYDKIVFECDGCGDTLETEERAFIDAQEKLNIAGWKAKAINTMTGAKFEHYCEQCGKRK
jgi:hypothetical protein